MNLILEVCYLELNCLDLRNSRPENLELIYISHIYSMGPTCQLI